MKNCNTNGQYTINVPENTSFAVVFPLKRRTFVAQKPIDTDINCAELEDVVVTIGGVEYTASCGLDGVRVVLQDGLPRGIYDSIITAMYHGSKIRAAYFENIRSVEWNYQSDAQNYLPGSPIVAEAAYIIGGALTDAELEELKVLYREAIAEEEAAKAAAIAEKEKYVEKIEELDDLAKESTLNTNTDTIRGDIAAVANAIAHIDFSALATKQGQQEAAAVLATILQRIGAPNDPATANTLFGAILNIASQIDFTTVINKLDAMWGTNAQATLTAILAAVNDIDTSDPYSKALAEFFGVTLLQGYEFMTDSEVTDELEDIMQALDPGLEQEVEYPEGSGTYMTKAQAITAEAMQIINPSQS